MKIFDLHNDFLTTMRSYRAKNRYLSSKDLHNTQKIVGAVWTSELEPEKALLEIEKSYDLINTQNQNKNSCMLAIEDLHFVSKINIDRVINANPLYCGLTWNFNNNLAGGALEGGNLTEFGKEVVELLEQNNIQIDTAHLSEKSFMDVASITQKPIFCSHTAVASLTNHPRNLKDYQLKMISESQGIVGICLVSDFLSESKKSTIGDVARHIDYVASRFDPSIVALGTDFFGTKHLPKSIKNYNNLKCLEERLRFMGYDTQTIEMIFYKNASNFFGMFEL